MKQLRAAEPIILALFVAAACFWGCGDDDSGPTGPGETVLPDSVAMPDFSLKDVNATSPTYNQQVSPRDYLQQVSAWYFGQAT